MFRKTLSTAALICQGISTLVLIGILWKMLEFEEQAEGSITYGLIIASMTTGILSTIRVAIENFLFIFNLKSKE